MSATAFNLVTSKILSFRKEVKYIYFNGRRMLMHRYVDTRILSNFRTASDCINKLSGSLTAVSFQDISLTDYNNYDRFIKMYNLMIFLLVDEASCKYMSRILLLLQCIRR